MLIDGVLWCLTVVGVRGKGDRQKKKKNEKQCREPQEKKEKLICQNHHHTNTNTILRDRQTDKQTSLLTMHTHTLTMMDFLAIQIDQHVPRECPLNTNIFTWKQWQRDRETN